MEFGGARALTAGMALFGAAAVAVASVPAIEAMPTAISSMALPRVENARIDLTTATADLWTLGGISLVAEAANRLGSSFLDTPLAVLIVGLDLVNGDNTDAYEQLKQFVDAPQYIADPVIVGLSQGLPSALGGGAPTEGWNVDPTGQSGIVAFRDNVMVSQWRNGAEALLASLMGVSNATSISDFNAADSLVGLIESEPATVVNALGAGVTGVATGIVSALATGDASGLATGLNELVAAPLDAVNVVFATLAAAVPPANAPFMNIANGAQALETALQSAINNALGVSASATTSTAAVKAAKTVTSTAAVSATTSDPATTPSSTTGTLAADKAALATAKKALSADKTALSTVKSQLQADKTAGASAQTLAADKQAASSAKADVKADKSTVKAAKSKVKSDKSAAKAGKAK